MCFPSREITTTIHKTVSFDLPEKTYPGEVLRWTIDPNIAYIYANGMPPAKLESAGKWIAGLGVSDEGDLWLSGVWQQPDANLIDRLVAPFVSQSLEYFSQRIKSERPNHPRNTKLRLLASHNRPPDEWQNIVHQKYRARLRQLWQNREGSLTESCWLPPVEAETNSSFGSPRALPSGAAYYHSGVDLRAKTGTHLRATAGGLVVYAEESLYPGKTVIIYHGGGIHSQYMHLSKINVERGQKVRSGEHIGYSGATGRVEGPHLHWEIQWQNRKLDPFQFLKVIDKSCPQEKT